MIYDVTYIILFSVNLIFIVTNFYGWLLKKFYVPYAYKDSFSELYPAQRYVTSLFLVQLFEIVYLFNIGNPKALFFVNGVSALVFPSFMFLMIQGYFLLKNYSRKQLFLLLFPIVIVALLLLLPLFNIIAFSSLFKNIMRVVIALLFGFYILKMVLFRKKLKKKIIEMDEKEYSNEKDFSLHYAWLAVRMTLLVCFIAFSCFIIDNVYVKMVRDIPFIVINTWFAIYSLNPHRTIAYPKAGELKKKEESKKSVSQSKYRLTKKQCAMMYDKLMELLYTDKPFLEEHFTLTTLAQRMNTNKNYLSEVIARSKYKTFYTLVNSLRIEHACTILLHDPTMKLEQVAFSSGFPSASSFSQVFKRFKNISPREFVKSLNK